MENPGKKKENNKKYKKRFVSICYKNKCPYQLPTHPQTSIGCFPWQFEYGFSQVA